MRYVMVIDTYKCIGCNACTVICKQAHATPPGVFWNRVYVREVGEYPRVRTIFIPSLCMHCTNAPCVRFCPTGASYRRERDGLVLINQEKCIGCRACMSSCPYESRFFNSRRNSYYEETEPSIYEKARAGEQIVGTVSKCTFCVEELVAKREPLCVTTCPSRARMFGDLHDSKSDVARLVSTKRAFPMKPELGTGPSIYFLAG